MSGRSAHIIVEAAALGDREMGEKVATRASEKHGNAEEISVYAEFGAWATTGLALGYPVMLFVAESAEGWLGKMLANVRLYRPVKPGDMAIEIAYWAEFSLALSLAICSVAVLSAHLGMTSPDGKWKPILAASVPPAILSFASIAVLGWVGDDTLMGKVLPLAFIILGALMGMLTSGALADAAAKDARAELERARMLRMHTEQGPHWKAAAGGVRAAPRSIPEQALLGYGLGTLVGKVLSRKVRR